MSKTIKPPETLTRNLSLSPAIDGEVQSISFSSETPFSRSAGGVQFEEVLVHTVDAIDMTYAKKGLPMHREHLKDGGRQIGRISNFHLSADGKTRGEPKFSRSAAGKEAKADVEDQILTDASLHYRWLDFEPMDDRGRVRVTKWQPIHADLVATGADPTVGANRSLLDEGFTMTDKTVESQAAPIDEQTLIKRGAQAERNRQKGIETNFKSFIDHDWARSLLSECLDDLQVTPEIAAMRLLQRVGEANDQAESYSITGAHRSISSGRDSLDKFMEGAALSQGLKYGLCDADEEHRARQSEFNGLSLLELGRSFYDRAIGDSRGLDKMALVGRLFTRSIDPGTPAQLSADFPAILENIAAKTMDRGWQRSPVTWDVWTNPGTAPDYKQFSRPKLGKFGELRIVAAGDPYLERKRADDVEYGTLTKSGELTSLSREAVINDDLSAFAETTTDLGEAANRTVNLRVYRDTLVANVAMNDTFPIFDEINHGNLLASGGPPDVSQLENMRARMARQTDNTPVGEGGPNPINYQPAFLLCPTELGPQARALVQATSDPRAFSGTGEFNTASGQLVVVEDVVLADALEWYLVSNKSTIEVTGLNGSPRPTIERETGWTVDSLHWKVRIEFTVVPRDFRSMQFNPGA